MQEASIGLRPLNSLLTDDNGGPARYWIPAYQRGYRWTSLQVTQLLDDIWEFIQNSEGGPREAFYCLQPIVVKERSDGAIEVVDGQQRLTTFYIILTYLKTLVAVLEKQRFRISFETRSETNEPFLEEIDTSRAEENVDFFHISKAYEAVGEWFSEREPSHKLKLLQHLLNDDEAGRNVKVIWFTLPLQDDPVAAFTRLNVGKIPLTNDELIRALFIRRATAESNDGLSLRIAHEWDQLEKALQRDAFWYFLSNDPPPSHNRIGLLFKLAAEKDMDELLKQDAYGVFQVFNMRLAASTAERVWLSIKQTFMALEEWFEDRTLFHVGGFLIHQGESINALLDAASSLKKRHFLHELKRRIYKAVIIGDTDQTDADAIKQAIRERCESLNYRKRKDVKALLLLFNLATLLGNTRSNMRFQFDNFKHEKWDIEHVRSVTENQPKRHDERRDWLSLSRGYLLTCEDAGDLLQKIDAFLSLAQRDATDALFEPLYEEVLTYFKEADDGGDDGIENLTLLDRSTNRSYKNAVFAVKRQRLLELDQAGIFVPLCTRNVFLKCYSPQVDNVMFWGATDAASYGDAIIETLSAFFNISEETQP